MTGPNRMKRQHFRWRITRAITTSCQKPDQQSTIIRSYPVIGPCAFKDCWLARWSALPAQGAKGKHGKELRYEGVRQVCLNQRRPIQTPLPLSVVQQEPVGGVRKDTEADGGSLGLSREVSHGEPERLQRLTLIILRNDHISPL